MKNPQLAQTLREIARRGPGAFYTGPIVADIVKRVTGSGNPGTLSLADLRGYRAKARDPICTDYKRWKVCGMPPPSSGGIAIARMLGTLQALEAHNPKCALAALAPRQTTRAAGFEPSVDAAHVVSEAGRQADADRGLYVADADFVPVNVQGLIDPAYRRRWCSIATAAGWWRRSVRPAVRRSSNTCRRRGSACWTGTWTCRARSTCPTSAAAMARPRWSGAW